jgi:CubicO group peptidase (beta-lactamase class C family)
VIAPGFEDVAAEVERTRGDGAVAFAAVVDGETVVDVTCGLDDDALVLVFSGTKGFVAVCLLLLIERGELELDAPVRRYWPGFHDGVLVRHVVSHTAGLPGLRRGFSVRDLLDRPAWTCALEREPLFWPPGERVAYHALTYGWLCDELVRRIDGRSVGQLFADEVAGPLGLELWVGLPAELEPRVAQLRRSADFGITYLGDEPEPMLAALYGGLLDEFPWNDPEFHRVEIPAANAIGTARSIARLYGSLERVLAPETMRLASTELSRGPCAVTQRPYAFGVGFELQTELETFGPPRDAFGHSGSGGSRHGAWPSERAGFSYAMTELRPEASDDRAARVLAVLAQALRARSSVDQKSSPVSM